MLPVLGEYGPRLERQGIEIVTVPVNERLSEEELLPIVEELDGVICGDDQFTERVLKAAPRLKVISKWGTGIDSIDSEACRELGIQVCNTPGAFTEPVADTVLGYMLAFARRLPWMDRDIRNGEWRKPDGVSLHERVLGVVGVGNIGRAVVRRAIAFGMKVMGNDIVDIPSTFVTETRIEMVALETLLEHADFISMHTDLNATSFHLMSDDQFALVKPTAYLINTSRGPVIDEPALVKALQEKRLAGAAMDVFENEPLPEDSPLRSMDNCLLAPHNSNSSPGAKLRVHEDTIRNLLAVLQSSD
jgi:D-3-phosphoglycerate dehydrogenase